MTNVQQTYLKIPKRWKINLIFSIAMLVALIYSFAGSEINILRLSSVFYSFKYMILAYTKINWDLVLGMGIYPFSDGVVYMALETLAMAFFGTLLGGILAIPLGFLSSETVGGKTGSRIGSAVLVLIRVFPEIILAVVLLKGFGINSMTCVMAIGIHSVGMLGKLFAEAIDNMDKLPLEALDAVGANRWQKIRFGILPQIAADFSSVTLYRLDINVRSASVLGIVAAGGFGAMLSYASAPENQSVLAALMVVIVPMILIMDAISGYLRGKLI